MVEILKYQAIHSNITISVFVDEEFPKFVQLDPDRFLTILLNLLSNSLKFTSEGFIKIFCELKDESSLLCRVEDSGTNLRNE